MQIDEIATSWDQAKVSLGPTVWPLTAGKNPRKSMETDALTVGEPPTLEICGNNLKKINAIQNN